MPAPDRVMPEPNLSGSIVVLTHPRTGSSLLMQTLRLLGVEVAGETMRVDLPREANPRGYYENLDVLLRGLCSPELVQNPELLRGRAFKLGLHGLTKRRARAEWRWLERPDLVLLLPIRSPTESIGSQEVLEKTSADASRRSIGRLVSVREHLANYSLLSRWVNAPEFRRPPPVCLDYRQAIERPHDYVARVVAAAGLCPTEAQRIAAVANIDGSLYRFRYRASEPPAAWATSAPVLEQIYALLRDDAHDKWSRLAAHLPRWVHDAHPWVESAAAPLAPAPPTAAGN